MFQCGSEKDRLTIIGHGKRKTVRIICSASLDLTSRILKNHTARHREGQKHYRVGAPRRNPDRSLVVAMPADHDSDGGVDQHARENKS